jgi:glycosyltransferase involved in cell wall biosynthesis
MTAEKISIIIPARNEPYLQKTIDDLFQKADGEIEVIAMLDGYWPKPPLISQDNLIIIHNGEVRGMRITLNQAARIATGKYLMKTDAHCMFDEGFDQKLKDHCKSNWLTVPSRYRLDAANWKCKDKPAIEYLYLTYPYITDDMYGAGFHGRKLTGATRGVNGYYEPENKNKDKKIDEIMIFQGSCWFMHKEQFFNIEGFDEQFENMWQEPTELAMKTWLSGGKVMRNKHTWYAHWHKNTKEGGRGYRLSKKQQQRVNKEVADYWMNNCWDGQIHPIKWYVEKFNPPGWPENWTKNLNNKIIDYDAVNFSTNALTKSKKGTNMTGPKEVNRAIKDKFRVKRRDIPPFTGWLKPSSREDLYDVMNDLGCFKSGAEIGVAEGHNAKKMLDKIEGLNLICVDPWHKYANWTQERMDKRYNKTLKNLDPYKDRVQVIRKTSMDAIRGIGDASLDFVYIDGFHDFDWVMADLIFWAPKVRSGGIVAGHDYYPFYRAGIITAVDASVKAHNIQQWYVTREQKASFFWVK